MAATDKGAPGQVPRQVPEQVVPSVTETHRELVLLGQTVYIGGYSASSDAELDLMEAKLGANPEALGQDTEVRKDDKGSSDVKSPDLIGLLNQTKDALIALAAAEGAAHEGNANKDAIALAILAKRAEAPQ